MGQSWMEALELEFFIRKYIPKGWKEPIERVFPSPWLLSIEYEEIIKGNIPVRLDTPGHREAIEAYFKRNARPEEKKSSTDRLPVASR